LRINNKIGNLILIFLSTSISLSLSNIFLLFFINNFNQKSKSPVGFIEYIPHFKRWKFHDLYNKSKNEEIITIVGDSFAYGYGDALYEKKYDFSAAHFLSKNSNYNYQISANGGTFLPLQLSFLEDSIEKKYSLFSYNLNFNFKKIKNKRLIAFFYEGNDLDNYFLYSGDEFINKNLKTKFKRYISNEIPLVFLIRKILRNKIIPFIFTTSESKTNEKPNQICIKSNCFNIPIIQSASLQLSKKQINEALKYTLISLNNFQEKYDADVCLVYIPSPATIYHFKNIYFQEYYKREGDHSINYVRSTLTNATKNSKREIFKNKLGIGTKIENENNSRFIREQINSLLDNPRIVFKDSTNFFKEIGKNIYIHGKIDSKHFNQTGYRFLSEFILMNINDCFKF